MKKSLIYSVFLFLFANSSCQQKDVNTSTGPADRVSFGDYWYQGKAEVNTFSLDQARYGEMRKGTAVMIFVTEPFSLKSKTKANEPTEDDPVVMKLNFTRKFVTGIYPYTMMTSVFYPVNKGKHALKVSASVQEWCGQVYVEMNKKNKYDVMVRSYFEGESKNEKMRVVALEDEILTQIRINPATLPVGDLEMIPSFTFTRLKHVDLKPYHCHTGLIEQIDTNIYVIDYKGIDRKVEIKFQPDFPYRILGWRESYKSGFGEKARWLTSSGQLQSSVLLDYWTKNSVADSTYRKELKLDN